MMRSFKLTYLLILIIIFSGISSLRAQVLAGPMLGAIELRTAKIWVEVKPGHSTECWYWKKGEPGTARLVRQSTDVSAWYAPLVFDLVNLDINSTYEYAIVVDGNGRKRPASADGQFTTQDLWQWRKPAPDFTFLTGSCAYFNEPEFDRPGKPYGGDSSIFKTMAAEPAAFMLWLGDNWYTREADYFSKWGLWYRAHRDRGLPILQDLLKAMPQYAIWDDHDYGPNDGDRSYIFKEESRKIFEKYWANPGYGMEGSGIYTKFSYSDCDFFLMDDRYFRDADDMNAYVNGRPNPNKRMWGKEQMTWLKNALLQSKATFKFIVTGSQTLNPVSPFDCLQEYPVEFNDIMNFLDAEHINGIVFLTGDRHHSEVVRYDRAGTYPLYDITSSPFTSGIGRVFGPEKDNPYREKNTLVEAQNYARIKVSGEKGKRVLSVSFAGLKGETLAQWSVSENDLRAK